MGLFQLFLWMWLSENRFNGLNLMFKLSGFQPDFKNRRGFLEYVTFVDEFTAKMGNQGWFHFPFPNPPHQIRYTKVSFDPFLLIIHPLWHRQH